ncbi:cupin domain-containing protein [Desulfitobacterium sp.]|uniref:cupin domain-containing protein n=1 Tax=Desulfitobacterium sp. TaxID=49981 RepID=UPI002B220A8B|nr:cupin domain-containing protein [Desulfitobacterium sp.]MEA4900295.1 cupin domain-containing protein [Desulfitobacterium sp.]
MLVRNKNKIDGKVRGDGVTMVDLFGGVVSAGEGVTMGHAIFPAGTVVPPAAHSGDEYSYVISGNIKCKIGDQIFSAQEGSATFIPAGEEHSSINDSDGNAEVVWMLIEQK